MTHGQTTTAYVVMGASGCGKSTVGRALAQRLGVEFVDGDDLHPASNVAMMAAGTALTDADREPWLAVVGDWIRGRADKGAVVACSALKRAYRDAIQARAGGDVVFIHLDLPESVLAERVLGREHFFPPHLLTSQLQTLEPLSAQESGRRVDGTEPVDTIVAAILAPQMLNAHAQVSAGVQDGERAG